MTEKQLVFQQDFTPLRLPGSEGVVVAQCTRAGNFVWITGQTGHTFDGMLVGAGDAGAQARQACDNLKALMEMAGGSLGDIVRVVTHVTDRGFRDAVYPVMREYFGEPVPCGTGLVVEGLAREEMLVEIDAWAFIDDEDTQKSLVRSKHLGPTRMTGTAGMAAQVYRAGNHVYIQGQTAYTLDGALVGVGDPAAQARQACENIEALMEAASGSLGDLVRVVTYVTDSAHRLAAYPVIESYLGDPLPCGTGLVVPGLAREELLVEIDAWGFIDDDRVSKTVVRTQDLAPLAMPGSTGRAVQCCRAGNHVYIQGQTAFTLDGELIGIGDAAAQARQACENIKALIEMAGGGLGDVVRIIVYVTDRAHRTAVYPMIRQYFDALWPCGTGIVVKGLAREELLVEIDAWGFIDDPS